MTATRKPTDRAPVQGDRHGPPGTVPWRTHELAWERYRLAGHWTQSAERIAERGGFSYREIQCALAGHYNDCARCTAAHDAPAGFEPSPVVR